MTATTPIFALPDELLLQIAADLSIRDLHNFSRTHRCFRAIAKEELICWASCSPHHIFSLIETLPENPSLVSKMTHLQFVPMTEDMHDKMIEIDMVYRAADTKDETYAAEIEVIDKAYPSAENVAWKEALLEIPDLFSVGLSLLIARARDVTALTLGTNALDSMLLMNRLFRADTGVKLAPWVKQVRSTLAARLTELAIYGESSLQGYPYASTAIDLQPFSRLKSLSATYAQLCIGGSHLYDILPNSLTNLRVTDLSVRGFDYTTISRLFRQKAAHHQCSVVELQFLTNVWATADTLHDLLRGHIVRELHFWNTHPSIELRTMFGNHNYGHTWPGEVRPPTMYPKGDFLQAIMYLVQMFNGNRAKNMFVIVAVGTSVGSSNRVREFLAWGR